MSGDTGLRETIPAALDGERLDRVVALLGDVSRSRASAALEAERVTLDGKVVTLRSHRVREGEELIVTGFERDDVGAPAPDAGVPVVLLHADKDVLVVDKPAGLVVHPGAGNRTGTLVNGLLASYPEIVGVGSTARPGIVHRLDRGTSGVMVVAKHDAAHTQLSRQFANREVDKEYIALVWGLLNTGRRIDAPLGRDLVNRQKMSTRSRRSRSAVTRVTGTERLRGLTLATVTIATGRTHQIRVHLNSIGHPIVGDSVYGGIRRHLAGDHSILASLDRPFLHAWHLAFSHPRDGRKVDFTAPLPEDLQAVLTELRTWHNRENRQG